MFNSVSMTGTGIAITLIEYALSAMNVTFDAGSVSAAVNGLISFVGLLLVVWGQIRRKDLTFGMFRY